MAVYTANGVQICFLRLFEPHEKSLGQKTIGAPIGFYYYKSLCPKNKTLVFKDKVKKPAVIPPFWRYIPPIDFK